jgi:cobalt-zinc-cadmium efflux system membrane fusion protein
MKKEATLDLAKKTAAREAKLFEKKISAETEVQQAQATLLEAQVECANARTRLLRLGFSEEEVSGLAHVTLDNRTGVLTIRAPQSGFIVARAVSVGENLEPAKEAFVVSDLSEVWVWADLRESDIPRIAERTKGSGTIAAEVRTLGSETMVYRGTLDVLAGAMDEQTRTLKARVVIPNPDGLLRPGMFVNLRLFVPGERSALGVPDIAVLTDEGRQFVFVHKEGDYWVRRPVVVGQVFGNRAEIKEGLVPGQRIIADGSFLLKSDVLRQKMGAGCAD